MVPNIIRVLVAKPGLGNRDCGAKAIPRGVIAAWVGQLSKDRQNDDAVVIVGGIVPDEDAAQSKQAGVAGPFNPAPHLYRLWEFIRIPVTQIA